MTADLTPAQAARLEAIEAAPWAEEAAVERVAVAIWNGAEGVRVDWDETNDWWRNTYRRLAVAAIDVMRGATDDGALAEAARPGQELRARVERLASQYERLADELYHVPAADAFHDAALDLRRALRDRR